MTIDDRPTRRVLQVGDEPEPMNEPDNTRSNGRERRKPKRKMAGDRFRTLNSFVDFSLAELSRAEISVWLILYRDTRNGSVSASMDVIAKRAGCDRTTVYRAIRRLKKRGLLNVVHQGGFRKGASCYRVLPLEKTDSL